jgi:hypothetical protein
MEKESTTWESRWKRELMLERIQKRGYHGAMEVCIPHMDNWSMQGDGNLSSMDPVQQVWAFLQNASHT